MDKEGGNEEGDERIERDGEEIAKYLHNATGRERNASRRQQG